MTVFGSNLEGKARLIAPFSSRGHADQRRCGELEVQDRPGRRHPGGRLRLPDQDRRRPDGAVPVRDRPGSRRSRRRKTTGRSTLAQVIPSPVVVEGKSEGNDVDYFRFAGKKGQRIVVDAQCSRIGSGVDPTIRLTTAVARLRGLGRRHARPDDRRPALRRPARGHGIRHRAVRLPLSRHGQGDLSTAGRPGAGRRRGLPARRSRRRDDRPGAEGRDPPRPGHRLGDASTPTRWPTRTRIRPRVTNHTLGDRRTRRPGA